jgi:hypothetical protein
MFYPLIIENGLVIQGGDTVVSGNLYVTGNSPFTTSYALTASYVTTAQTASYITQSNNLFCYDTGSQQVATANTFQEIEFGNNSNLVGWTHTSTTGQFTASYSGIVRARLVSNISMTGTSNVAASRLLCNGTEVSGSYASFTVTTNNVPQELVSEAVFAVTPASVITAQFTATSSCFITGSVAIGSSVALPSAKIFIGTL